MTNSHEYYSCDLLLSIIGKCFFAFRAFPVFCFSIGYCWKVRIVIHQLPVSHLIFYNYFRLLRYYILINLLLCQNSSCCFRSSSKQYFRLQKRHFKPGFGGSLFLTLMVGLTGWYELNSISSSRILNSFSIEVLESSKTVNLFAR